MVIILAVSAGLRFYNVASKGLWYWDEAYYSNAAKAPYYMIKYIFEEDEETSIREYLMNRGVIGSPFVKPGHFLLLAISFILFGVHDLSPVIMMGLFGVAISYLVYKFGKEFLSNEVGLFGALIVALSGHMIFYSRSAFPQMDTVFFGLLGFYFYWTYMSSPNKMKYLWFSGSSFAFGMLMHQAFAIPILILLALESVRIWKDKPGLPRVIKFTYPIWGLITAVYLMVIGVSKLIYVYFPQIIPRTASGTLDDRTATRISTILNTYNFDTTEIITVLKMILTFEGLIVFILIFYGSVILWIKRTNFGKQLTYQILAQFWIVILYWSFFSGGHPTGKAFLVVIPHMAIIAGIGIVDIIERISKRINPIISASFIFGLIIFLGFLNVRPMLEYKSGYAEAAEKGVRYAKQNNLIIHREQSGLTPFLAFYLGKMYDEGNEETKAHIDASSKDIGDIAFLDYRRYFKPKSSIESIEAVKGHEPIMSVNNDWVQLRGKYFTHYGDNFEISKDNILSKPDAYKIWIYDISRNKEKLPGDSSLDTE